MSNVTEGNAKIVDKNRIWLKSSKICVLHEELCTSMFSSFTPKVIMPGFEVQAEFLYSVDLREFAFFNNSNSFSQLFLLTGYFFPTITVTKGA